MAAASPCRLSAILLRSLAWRPARALILKPWLAIIGLFSSALSGGFLGARGCVLHRPDDWMTALLPDDCQIGGMGMSLICIMMNRRFFSFLILPCFA